MKLAKRVVAVVALSTLGSCTVLPALPPTPSATPSAAIRTSAPPLPLPARTSNSPSVGHLAWRHYLDEAAIADRIQDPVARCEAYPDLPGNEWPAGSAKAFCPLLAPTQQPSLAQIKATLRAVDGPARLDRQYAAILAAHYSDPAHRDLLFTAYLDFGKAAGRPVAQAWFKRAPGSAYARMAMGGALLGAAQRARGSDWITRVPGQRIASMEGLLGQATPLLKAAIAAEPRLSIACVDLMLAGQLQGDDELESEATRQCLQVDPLSWDVNFQWLSGLDPRWGGSLEAMSAAIAQIKPRVAENPALGGLLARSMGMAAYLPFIDDEERLRTVAPQLEQAAKLAPDPLFIAKAGVAAAQVEDLDKALGYLSQALRLAPDSVHTLVARAGVRLRRSDVAGALADARRAVALEDEDCGCRDDGDIGTVFADAGHLDEARAAFRRDMGLPTDRRWAYFNFCATYVNGMFDRRGALDCTRRLAAEFPSDPQSLYLRAQVLYMARDPGADAAAARYRKVYDPQDDDQAMRSGELEAMRAHPFPYPNGGPNRPPGDASGTADQDGGAH